MTSGTSIGRRRSRRFTQLPSVRRTVCWSARGSRTPWCAASASAATIFGLTSSNTASSSAKPRAWISGPTMTRPVATSKLVRSTGAKKWSKVKHGSFFRDFAFSTKKKGATLKVKKAKDVRTIQVTAGKGKGYGRIAVYAGKTKVFATTLGHNNDTVADARYLDLGTRGLLWSVSKLDEAHLKPAKKVMLDGSK